MTSQDGEVLYEQISLSTTSNGAGGTLLCEHVYQTEPWQFLLVLPSPSSFNFCAPLVTSIIGFPRIRTARQPKCQAHEQRQEIRPGPWKVVKSIEKLTTDEIVQISEDIGC
jgi:hypothetical protein